MTSADLTALASVPKGLPGESYRHWKRRLTPEQWAHFLAVSRYLLDHSTQYYTFDCYIRARESA